MADDARISTAIRNHPKTRKLQKRLGKSGVLSLIWLFLYAAESQPDGDLSAMTGEDIELAADWDGAEGEFVLTLIEVRFIDGESGSYKIHDWAEHNPFAATRPKRVAAAKEANRIRWNRERNADSYDSDATRTKADSPPHHTTTLHTTPLKPKTKVADAPVFVCPDWIDPEVWRDFEEMRTKTRKKLTDGARRRIVAKLEAYRAASHDPNLILGTSIENGWAGVFEPKSFYGGSSGQNQRNGNASLGKQADRNEANRDAILAGIFGGHAGGNAAPGGGAGENDAHPGGIGHVGQAGTKLLT